LEESLRESAAKLQGRLAEDGKATESAISAAEAATRAAASAAREGREEVQSAADSGEAKTSQQAGSALEEHESARRKLSSLAGGLTKDIGLGREASEKAHSAAAGRASAIRAALATLQEALRSGLNASADAHLLELKASGERGALAAEEASGRRRCLQQGFAETAATHSASSSSRSQQIRLSLEALRANLDTKSGELERTLETTRNGLDDARGQLSDLSEKGRLEVTGAVTQAGSVLSAAWSNEEKMLEGLRAVLDKTTADQRAANSGVNLSSSVTELGLDLTEALGTAVGELLAACQSISLEVESLQKQRCSEQETIRLLTEQRETLQADVGNVREQLECSRSQLASACGELSELEVSQSKRRASALDSISRLVKDELERLGEELATSTTQVSQKLGVVSASAAGAATAAEAAEGKSSIVGEQVAEVARAWSREVRASCDVLSAAQKRCAAAAENIEVASTRTSERLESAARTAVGWGEACERVAVAVEDSSGVVGKLSEAQERLQPQWKEAHKTAMQAVDVWCDGGKQVCGALDGVLDNNKEALGHLAELGVDVAKEQVASVAAVAMWEEESAKHAASLADLKKLSMQHDEKDIAFECSQKLAVDNLCTKAGDIRRQAAAACGDTDGILRSVDELTDIMPKDFQANDLVLASAALGVDDLLAEAAASLDRGSEAVTGLRELYKVAAQQVKEAARKSDEAAATATSASAEALERQRAVAAASAEHSLSLWKLLEDSCASALDKLGASSDSAEQTSSKAAKATQAELRALLQKGDEGKGQMLAEISTLVADLTQGLAKQQTALKADLSASPLSAFGKGSIAEVPAWPSRAKLPEMALRPRLTKAQLAAEFQAAGPPGSLDAAAFDADAENAGCQVHVDMKLPETKVLSPSAHVVNRQRSVLQEVNRV